MTCFIKVKREALDKLSEQEQFIVEDAIWDTTTKGDGFILDVGKLSPDLELKLMLLSAEERALKKLKIVS